MSVERTCRTCGYDLRGASGDGLCPECATPLSFSPAREGVARLPPSWLLRVDKGLWLLQMLPMTGLALLAVVLAGWGLGALGPRWWQPETWTHDQGLAAWLGRGLLLLGFLQTAVGVVLITHPEPRCGHGEPVVSLRRVVRLAGPSLLMLAFILPLFGSSWGTMRLAQSVLWYMAAALLGIVLSGTALRLGLSSASRLLRFSIYLIASSAVLMILVTALVSLLGVSSIDSWLRDYGPLELPGLIGVVGLWIGVGLCRAAVRAGCAEARCGPPYAA